MMKHVHSKRKKFIRFVSLWVLILALSNCEFVINSITQPVTANAGEEITAKLDANFKIEGGPYARRVIVGILAPKSWKLVENAKLTFTGDKGSGTLTPISAAEVASSAKNGENWATHMKNKLGIGPNYIDDMEWVPFQTTQNISASNGNNLHAEFQIKMKVGIDGQNTSVKLGYMICNKDDGLKDDSPNLWPVKYADCLQVTGTGDLIDYCNPSLAILNPAKVLDNEYATITFDNAVIPTALKGENQIYLCATAHTSDGKNITVCSQTETSLMQKGDLDKFSLTLWPRKYFNLAAGQSLSTMDYFFTDKTGSVKVGYGNTTAPFILKFLCE